MQKINDEVIIPLLLDLYGNMLSQAQYIDLDFYYNQDLSLSEIADNVGKSRQGVFDSIKRAEAILLDVEEKLKFLEKTIRVKKDFAQIEKFASSGKAQSLKNILDIAKKYKSE